jgi:hypothetical protein
LDGPLPICCRVCFGSSSIHPGAIGNQGPKLGRELLYSSLSISFGLRGIRPLARRLNDAVIRYGFSPFGYCFVSFSYYLLARIQLCFALSKLLFSAKILFLAGASHCQRDEYRKDMFFISPSKCYWFRSSQQETGRLSASQMRLVTRAALMQLFLRAFEYVL